jgi:hypothetical protein
MPLNSLAGSQSLGTSSSQVIWRGWPGVPLAAAGAAALPPSGFDAVVSLGAGSAAHAIAARPAPASSIESRVKAVIVEVFFAMRMVQILGERPSARESR